MAELDPEAVFKQVVAAAHEITEARYVALGILDRERHEFERLIQIGIDEETLKAIGSLPRGRGVLGELIENPGGSASQ